ncbi:scarecrow-like protein 3 [Impatiens glandulifera]|uniref:scarecrow-like protein 3 n=1 Tax=Impatiens glandulifera TaxID=253017 RepID=UPI001FB0D1E9|nr:scarecrow-like protein 3 [Impatiens glandulifera]
MTSSSPAPEKTQLPISLTLATSNTSTVPSYPKTAIPKERNLKLINLLLSCVNHASSGNLHRADACLRKISRLSSHSGDSFQRLSAWLASALAVRLIKRWPGLFKTLIATPALVDPIQHKSLTTNTIPFLNSAYTVMNRVLTKAMSNERLIHIVDLGCGDPNMWIPFLQNLSNSHLRITCVHTSKAILDNLYITLLKETNSLCIELEFNPLNIRLSDLNLDMMNLRPSETLAFAATLSLHVLLTDDDDDNNKMGDFLVMIRSTSPKVFVMVEQESDHNLNRLEDRFVESMHYYSAVFESISKFFVGDERLRLEQVFGKEMENILACEGREREERHERFVKWSGRFERCGFGPVGLWFGLGEELEEMDDDGLKMVYQRSALIICWYTRPIYSVSAWN